MKQNKNLGTMLFLLIGIFVVILDTKTALTGANEGLEICIKSVIPSLFPFLVLTSCLNSHLAGIHIRWLDGLNHLLGIPIGAETALVLGLLGGYPVGAQCVTQLYRDGCVSERTAKRMLGFCNNAGPAFIFGMTGLLFSNPWIPWLLWLLQIISALMVGFLLPDKMSTSCHTNRQKSMHLSHAVENGVRVISLICGWVILFRICIAFLRHWFLWMFSREIQIIVIGILELANGCYELQHITNEGLRFLLCSCLLSFGGISVLMQTGSVCGSLNTGSYIFGKVIQCTICMTISYWLQYFLFSNPFHSPTVSVISVTAIVIIVGCTWIRSGRKKVVAIPA